MKAFETTRPDGVPPWRVLYNYIAAKAPEIDEVFTHAELRQAAELFGSEYYAVVGRASKEFERVERRTLVAVRGEGYRYAAGVRQIDRGVGYRKRSRRSMNRALQLMQSADYGIMQPEDRVYSDRQRNAVIALCSIIKQHDEKLVSMAAELNDVRESTIRTSQRQAATEEQITAIERQLEELRRQRRSPEPPSV